MLQNSSYFPYSSHYQICAEIFFVHSDFSLTSLFTNDFSLNNKKLYDICMHVNSVQFCAYREKLEGETGGKALIGGNSLGDPFHVNCKLRAIFRYNLWISIR